jgi:hypothetical protein
MSGAGYLGRQLLEWIDPNSLLAHILAILLVFFQATLINRLTVMHRLSNQITLTAGFLWVFLSALHPQLMGFSAQSVAILIILIGMNGLFKAYQKRNAEINVFNTAFFFSLSSLLYYPLSFLLIFGIIGLYTLRTIRQIEIRQYLVGWITPYFLAFCLVYVFASIQEFISYQWTGNWALIDFSSFGAYDSYPFWIFTIIIFAICMLNYSMYFSKKIIYAQKKISTLFTYFLFIFIAAFFVQSPGLIFVLFLLWPLSFFLSESLITMNNQMLAELFTWIVILFSFFMQYQTIF